MTDDSDPVLHATAPLTSESKIIVWQAGTPHTGALLEPARAIDAVIVGYSGGGPHALATVAAEPTRIRAVVVVGCPAPYRGDPAWFEGMADDAALRSALRGTTARDEHPEEFDPRSFIARDHAALEGSWGALGVDAGASDATADGGAADDDVAFVTDWGFPVEAIDSPVRIVHGRLDRVIPVSHAASLAHLLPHATVTVHDDDGHVSVLEHLDQHVRAALV